MKHVIKIIVICTLILPSNFSFSQTSKNKPFRISKSNIVDNDTWIDVNNIRMVTTNRGSIAWDIATEGGLEYPKGSGKYAIFASGLWMGGKVGGEINVAIADYSFEYYPGSITSTPGTIPVTWANGDEDRWQVLKLSAGDGPENPDYTLWKEMAQFGAPVDVYGNPIITGEQMLWTIFNDADSSKHTNKSGRTNPLNIEVQESVFAFTSKGLEDVVFLKFKLINKGPEIINDYYLSFWSDPDLGYVFNDIAGCDSTLNLGYFYNADNIDDVYSEYGIAGGILLLKGLENIQGDTLSMHALNKYINGTDPTSATKVYNCISGSIADNVNSVLINPVTGENTKYFGSGDPVTNTGWIDESPSDIRINLSTGPIDFAVGDTQEVIFAILIETGIERISAVENLKKATREIKSIFKTNFSSVPPEVKVNTNYVSTFNSEISIRTTSSPGASIYANIYDYSGNLKHTMLLYDDGVHSDSLANDGLYSNSWSTQPLENPLFLTLKVSGSTANDGLWERIVDRIATKNEIEIIEINIKDNINNDGIANPSEQIAILPVIENSGSLDISNLRLFVYSDDPYVEFDSYWLDINTTINAGQIHYTNYEYSNHVLCYLNSGIPNNYQIKFKSELYDENQNKWENEFYITVVSYAEIPDLIETEHIAGNAFGTFGIKIVDKNALTGHTYRIEMIEAYPIEKFNLIDVNRGIYALTNYDLPDQYSLNMPITDGFRIFKNTILTGKNEKWEGEKTTTREFHKDGTAGTLTLQTMVTFDTATYDAGSYRIRQPIHLHFRGTYEDFTPHTSIATPVEIMNRDIEIRCLGVGNGQVATAINGQTGNWTVDQNYTTPFEVWDIEADGGEQQINFCWWDRDSNGKINAYNSTAYDRIILVNTPYDPTGIHTPESNNATWYFSIYEDDGDLLSNPSQTRDQWTSGQIIELSFPNYISSKDTFVFTTTLEDANNWTLPINISNSTTNFSLKIGESISATDSFDVSYDSLAPPPGLNFYAYINSGLASPYTYFRQSIKDTVKSEPNVWNIAVTNTNNATVTLSWDTSLIPSNKTLLIDGSVDMSAATTYQFIGDKTIQITASFSDKGTQDIALKTGWNLVSTGVTPDNNAASAIFPDALAVYKWENNSYVSASTIEAGQGYWVAVASDETISITGDKATNWSRSLLTGWHLIGGLFENKAVSNLSPASEILIVYGYNTTTGQYQQASTLETGKGYWLAVSSDTSVSLSKSGMNRDNITLNKKPWNTFLSKFSSVPPPPPNNDYSQFAEEDIESLKEVYNYPNPFNSSTSIYFKLSESEPVIIRIYNILGEYIKEIYNGECNKGVNKINWNGLNSTGNTVSSGLYIYVIKSRTKRVVGKMLFLK